MSQEAIVKGTFDLFNDPSILLTQAFYLDPHKTFKMRLKYVNALISQIKTLNKLTQFISINELYSKLSHYEQRNISHQDCKYKLAF